MDNQFYGNRRGQADALDAVAANAERKMSMGVWYKPKEWFKKFCRKKDLREVCLDKYGGDFVEMYDMVNNGIPIGNLRETQIFLAMVKAAEESEA